MSDGDWRPILAIGIIITLLFAPPLAERFGLYQARHAQERVQAAQHDAGASRQQGEADCTPVSSQRGFSCALEIEQPSNADPYAEYDLRAQQEMAQWALGVLIATVAGVAVTIVGLIFIVAAYRLNNEQVRLARDANENSRRALEEAERPLFFVRIDDGVDEGGALRDEESYALGFEEQRGFLNYIEFHNVGTRPAFGVALRTAVGFLGTADQDYRFVTDGMFDYAVGAKRREFVLFNSREPIASRLDAGAVLHISGTLTYDDALGIRRERGFRFVAKLPEGLWRQMMPRLQWDPVNDPRYSYDRRKDSDAL